MTPPDSYSQALPHPRAGRPTPRVVRQPPAQGLVAQRLRARARRVKVIRRRIVAIASATFLATSTGIMVQLVSGHDPALVRSAAAAKTATVASTPAKVSTSTTSGATKASSAKKAYTAATTAKAKKTSTVAPVTTSAS